MKLSRDFTAIIHFAFDEMLPPMIRDNRIFMSIFFRLLFGPNYKLFLDFKTNLLKCKSQKELSALYSEINKMCLKRETDLNQQSLAAVLSNVVGKTALDMGAGRCYLAARIAEKFEVTACDTDLVPSEFAQKSPIKLVNAAIEDLPFEEKSFDTVVCTHTLEHVIDISAAIKVLRNLARKRLILVVPRQRHYRYTFDTHIHFFPTLESFITTAAPLGKYEAKLYANDIFYCEEIDKPN